MSLMDDLPEGCVETDTLLLEKGYRARRIPSDDPYLKYVIYFKDFRRANQNMMFRIELKFDLVIEDSPFGTYNDNHQLYFEEARLAVYDRRMDEDPDMLSLPEGPFYLEETERPIRIGAQDLRIFSLEDLTTLEEILGDD